MRISDWGSEVGSSDLLVEGVAGVGGVRWVQVVRLARTRCGTIHRRRLRHCLLRLRTVKLVLGARIRWRRRRPVLGAVEFGSGGEATGGGELIQKLPSGQIHYTGFFNV